jgi:hypothetical protein
MRSLHELEPGKWYIAFVCMCTVMSILFDDVSDGKGTTEGTYFVTCPACGRRGWYRTERYHHDPEPALEESKAVNCG